MIVILVHLVKSSCRNRLIKKKIGDHDDELVLSKSLRGLPWSTKEKKLNDVSCFGNRPRIAKANYKVKKLSHRYNILIRTSILLYGLLFRKVHSALWIARDRLACDFVALALRRVSYLPRIRAAASEMMALAWLQEYRSRRDSNEITMRLEYERRRRRLLKAFSRGQNKNTKK